MKTLCNLWWFYWKPPDQSHKCPTFHGFLEATGNFMKKSANICPPSRFRKPIWVDNNGLWKLFCDYKANRNWSWGHIVDGFHENWQLSTGKRFHKRKVLRQIFKLPTQLIAYKKIEEARKNCIRPREVRFFLIFILYWIIQILAGLKLVWPFL